MYVLSSRNEGEWQEQRKGSSSISLVCSSIPCLGLSWVRGMGKGVGLYHSCVGLTMFSLETTRMSSHISKPVVTYYYLVRPCLLLLLLSAGGLHILKRSGSMFSSPGVQLFCLLASALSATGRRFFLLTSHPRRAIKHMWRQAGRHGSSSFFYLTCDNGAALCTS